MKNIEVIENQNIATISLNRPEVRNAFNPEMIEELKDVFKNLSKRQDLRAIVLKGAGKSFCAGADLNWMKSMVNYSFEQNKEDANSLFDMFQIISECSTPIIGLVQGAAFGGALGLIACCDYVISDEKTQFCFSEVKLGIAPAVISAFVLKKCQLGTVGPYMLTGKIFKAKEAQIMGLVHDIAEEDLFQDKLEVILTNFKEVGPEAVRSTKKLINQLIHLSWDEIKEETSEVISERRVSAEGQEGIKSFLEKRKPHWRLS